MLHSKCLRKLSTKTINEQAIHFYIKPGWMQFVNWLHNQIILPLLDNTHAE